MKKVYENNLSSKESSTKEGEDVTLEKYLNKITQGDCLELMKELPYNSIDLIVTDPPYGINWQSSRRIATERFDYIKGDESVDVRWLFDAYRVLKYGGAVYSFLRWDVLKDWQTGFINANFKIKSCLVWDRIIHGLGDLNGAYAPQYDNIIFAVKGKHQLRNRKRPRDVLRYQRVDHNKIIHPTQKPIGLIKYLVINSSDIDDIILDPFIGSGTTAVACKQLNRNFIGFDISKEYCEIARKRIEDVDKQKTLVEKVTK